MRFSTIFWFKRFDLGPNRTALNGFANFFIFPKIFHRKVQISRVRVVVYYTDMEKNLLDTDIFIFLNYCYWVCKNPFSFKICEKPSKYPRSLICVRVVTDFEIFENCVSAWSTTTTTPCRSSQRLPGHTISKTSNFEFLQIFKDKSTL